MKLMKFQADWCGPCKQLSKTIASMDISIPVELIDIDKQSDAAIEYGIRSIPTMILVDENHQQLRRIHGAVSKEQLEEFLGEYNNAKG